MSFLLDILFPKKCVGCNKSGSYFCTTCISNILQGELICPKCEEFSMGGETHDICKSPLGLDGLWSLGLYENPLRAAIAKLKYRYIEELSIILTDIMVEYWAKYQPFIFDQIKKDHGKGWVVVPVPLHWNRENDRGFNQSSLIGKLLAKKLDLNYSDSLKRIRSTKSQAKLTKTKRRENIKNAFEISSNYDQSTMNNVLLIDDVWTTGSTIRECCYILKQNGARKVWAITLAR